MLSNASVARTARYPANFEWVKTIFILMRGKESTCFVLTLVGLNFVVPFSRSSSYSFSIVLTSFSTQGSNSFLTYSVYSHTTSQTEVYNVFHPI